MAQKYIADPHLLNGHKVRIIKERGRYSPWDYVINWLIYKRTVRFPCVLADSFHWSFDCLLPWWILASVDLEIRQELQRSNDAKKKEITSNLFFVFFVQRSIHFANTNLAKDFFDHSDKYKNITGMNETELRNFQMWNMTKYEDFLVSKGEVQRGWLDSYLRPEL